MGDLLLYCQQNTLFFLLSITALGLLVGSFLNVVIYRLPIMLQRGWRIDCLTFLEQQESGAKTDDVFNLSVPRSRCTSCNHLISALENIPIISYIFLRGKCKSCRAPISIRYPIVELTTALLTLAVAMQFGVTLPTAAAIIFTWTLICLTLIDFDTQLLPDSITLPLLWLGLFLSLFNTFIDPATAIIGALAGYLSLWSVYWVFKLVTKKEGMGYGDFKLLAAIGAWLGWQMLPLVIMLSAFVGATIGLTLIALKGRDKSTPMPFGPFLSIAGFIALIWGEQLNESYLHFAGL
ncbi:MAG: prepilin peptidase [Piscirickettsiaceae bacterium]|nr:MAG: prepilin peptidase [Piscirickettsiaceae bacterium]PCI70838.1 MAG: prepilin peptidase [Piscirickettsiaceae bacterium]